MTMATVTPPGLIPMRKILLAWLVTVWSLSAGGMALAAEQEKPLGEMVAITVGNRVILSPDGSWEPEYEIADEALEAVTIHGQSVELRETTEKGKVTRTWKFSGHTPGLIQVVITRAVNTNKSLHSDNDNCVPVVAVRNLTQVNLSQIVVEAVFHGDEEAQAPSDIHGSTSVMIGRIVHGEEHERNSAPLFVPDCKGLHGTVTIPYCRLENGVRCEQLVDASHYGVIPLKMGTTEELDDHQKH